MITYVLVLVIMITAPLRFVFSQSDSSIAYSPDTTDLRNSFREEILLEGLNLEDEDSELLEYLENLKKNPIDLNEATRQQLETIPFLSSITVKKILSYRNGKGKFKSKRELMNIDGFSEELYERIKVYFIVRQNSADVNIDETGLPQKISSKSATKKFGLNLRTSFFQELQQRKGYITGRYEGSSLKSYSRVATKYNNRNYDLSLNLTSEKDPGEKNYSDFLSGNIMLDKSGFIRKVVAGDYTLNFGQGLSMWSGLSFSKGISSVSTVKKKGRGLRGYSSSNEVQFFRGVAINGGFKKFDFTFFYSANYFDAAIDTASGTARSIYYDGYHRNSAEIMRKNSLLERLSGGRVVYGDDGIKIGVSYWSSRFSKEISRDSSKKLYNFSGRQASAMGADYDFVVGSINVFGEWTRSQSGSVAYINSAQFTLNRIGELVFSYRSYPADFAPMHSNGFGEKGGETYNERGFYSGVSLRLSKGFHLNSYLDVYEFPYRTYFEPLPVSGIDFLCNAEWRVSGGLVFNLKYKNESREESGISSDEFNREVRLMHNRNQTSIRADMIIQQSEKIRLRSRYEYTSVTYELFGTGVKGTLFYSEIKLMPLPGFVFETRFSFFNTDNYDSRIYQYENDIKGVMSNAALFGKGRRWYVLIRCEPINGIEVSAKYGKTFYDGTKFFGSGDDEIKGDVSDKISIGIDAGL